MESIINQHETLIDFKTKSILFATRSEVIPNIEKIDQLRITIIKFLTEYIEFMDARPEEFHENYKYEYYWQLSSQCRSIILDAEAKFYQKRSKLYIKRYVAALLEHKDLRLEAQSLCEHGVNCQRCKDIMTHDADGKWSQRAIKRIDSHWFIEKFKKSRAIVFYFSII